MSKKIAIAAAVGALFAVASAGAFAYDGTITINGQVTSTTCSINAGSPNISVQLPTVSASTLTTAGATAGATPFTIALTNCTPVQGAGTAIAYFDDMDHVDMSTGNLVNTAAGGASNVQVALSTASGTPIALQSGGTQGQTPVSVSSGNATLNYTAQYKATGKAGSGPVSTYTTYSISYQ